MEEGIDVLRDRINAALKEAMKEQDKRRVSTLRLVNAAIKDRDIELRGAGGGPAQDTDVIALMQKMIRQREEAAALYDKGGRPELAAQEREELAILASWLPKAMSEEEMQDAIATAVRETGAGPKDIGKVMAALKARHAGRMDFSRASGLVKAALSG
jgi:uncharacterized protein YqeY